MNKYKVPFDITCPDCGKLIEGDLELTHNDLVPRTCSGIRPSGHATYYDVDSEQIKNYLQEKVNALNPDIKMQILPVYTEPSQREWEPHRGYAVISVAFSGNIIADQQLLESGYEFILEKIGNTKVFQSVAVEVIQRYRLNPDDFNKDYRQAEKNAHQFGISKDFAEAIQRMIKPKISVTKEGAVWVIVALSAAKIISDMLAPAKTKKLTDPLFITDVRKVSDKMVSFSVMIKDGTSIGNSAAVDPNVTALLEGIVKGK